jgi:hypothetical protein
LAVRIFQLHYSQVLWHHHHQVIQLTGSMAHMVECLPRKCEALSSNPYTAPLHQKRRCTLHYTLRHYLKFSLCLFCFCFLFFFGGTGIWIQGFTLAKQVLYTWATTSSPFYSGYFGDGDSRTICPGRPQTWILLISAS